MLLKKIYKVERDNNVMQMILCDTSQDLNKIIKKWKPIIRDNSIIATKNYLLYNSLKQTETIYLMQESFDSKYVEAVKILKDINKVIDKETKFSYLYEADYHIEGNGCGQWVTDALYAAELCSDFIKQYDINEVFVCCVDSLAMETRVLRNMELAGKIKLHVCYHKVTSKTELIQFIHCNVGKGWTTLKNCYYILYGILIFIKAFIKSVKDALNNNVGKKQERVLFSQGIIFITNAKKHLDWGIDFFIELNKHVHCAIICAYASEAQKFFKEHGLTTISFESAGIRMNKLITSIFVYYRDVLCLYKMFSKLDEDVYGTNMGQVVKLCFWQHLLLHVPERIVLDCIAEDFFSRYKFKMISTWLGSNNVYGRIFYQYTRNDKTIFWRRLFSNAVIKPTLFEEVYPDMLEYVYFIGIDKKELENFYRSFGWKGKAVLFDNSNYIIENKLTRENFISGMRLGKISVLWAPSYPINEHLRRSDFINMNRKMVCSMPSEKVELHVKYHLNCEKKLIIDAMTLAKNVHFFDNKERITDAFAVADVVVTTISTVVYDSIYNNKPCIILLEGQNVELLNEKIKEKFLIFYSVKEVMDYIENATKDDIYDLYVQERECMEELFQSDIDDVNYEVAQSLASICRDI